MHGNSATLNAILGAAVDRSAARCISTSPEENRIIGGNVRGNSNVVAIAALCVSVSASMSVCVNACVEARVGMSTVKA